ncbi:MAG: phosphoenolpyruvate mutase [Alphaproteobacteria bacterium]|nr:phosphoenolpyruvate mutase [Alphaproteobacteria bacterium]MBF0128673.1 phosphoenolpyruvate mutase [Alphaproteobacteria bacterium]
MTDKTPVSPSKMKRFRDLLTSPGLSFLMEAHNGMSALIVEDAGFEGIWASGLSISTALGVRDRNEASWTQVLEVLEFMSDVTSIPILLDGDTGYGDFNNFRRLVRKLCQRSIAAVCIEDKIFPKTNSFLDGDQTLANIDEFAGKIKAGKDSQTDPDFSIVARLEALIAGRGMDEALRRAEAYHAAGADAVLIHSRKSGAEEILHFAKEWANRCPVVIVPTMYYRTPTDRYREAGISTVIWANHNLRASLSAMREVSLKIRREESLVGIEDHVANLSDVFDLTGNSELAEAEKRYLPDTRRRIGAVVLAASRGSQLADLTVDRPKCMLDVRGEPILRRLVRSLRGSGVDDVTVVCGYRHEAMTLPDVRKVVNDAYASTGELVSLSRAADRLVGECVVSYGDILFRDHVLDLLLNTKGDVVLVCDAAKQGPALKPNADLVRCASPCTADHLVHDQPVELERIGGGLTQDEAHGEWVGLVRLSARGSELVRAELAAMKEAGEMDHATMPDLLSRLLARGVRPQVVYIIGLWLDVNDVFGLARARNFL